MTGVPPVRVHAGSWVHVRVHDTLAPAGVCRPALVLVAGDSTHRLRVVIPTGIGEPIGSADAEAWYGGVAVKFANVDGTMRDGDSWHHRLDCPFDG